MKTNEELVSALGQALESELHLLVRALVNETDVPLKTLEQQVLQAVFRLGRRWLETLLAWRTSNPPAAARRQGTCGHRQHLVGWRTKTLLTLLGQVQWSRPYYQCQEAVAVQGSAEPAEPDPVCAHGEAPADVALGVVGRRTSAGVQATVGYLAAQMPLECAAESFRRLLPLEMTGRQVEALIQPIGEALLAQEEAIVEAHWAEAAQARTPAQPLPAAQDAPPIERLYVELDGVLVRLRRGSIPLEAQEQERAGDVYREVKVGAAFAASRGPHRSDLAPGIWLDEAGPIRYVARRTAAATFGPLLYEVAMQAGLARAREVVVLGDGAHWIWELAAEHFPGATQIVDLWHAKQPVWNVAHAVFGRGTAAGAAWAEDACAVLVQGQITTLVEVIQALPSVAPPPGQRRSVPEVEADYFARNAERMHYPLFRAQGMQVGSGIAEAACKTVVSTRTKRAGMRWTPVGLDALLALRTAVLNNTYDAFWQTQTAVLV
jgi:hypothetical protein